MKELKTFTNLEVLNVLAWANRQEERFEESGNSTTVFPVVVDILDKVPVKVQFAFKKNIKALEAIKEVYEDTNKSLQEKYNNDEKSFDDVQRDNNGNPILVDDNGMIDENGHEIPVRRIREEYLEEFQKDMRELETAENDVDITVVEIEAIGDVTMSFNDLDMFSFMIKDE